MKARGVEPEEDQELVMAAFQMRVAHALANRDCANTGMEIPPHDHELWDVWMDSAKVVTQELAPELLAFFRYEKTIKWMTTCNQCAKAFDMAYQEAVGREMAQLALTEVTEWASRNPHLMSAAQVLEIIERRKNVSSAGNGDT